MNRLAALREETEKCRLCPLSETRNRVVFGSGNEASEIMLIGEAPGANEDSGGLPFIGQAGRLLDETLEEVGLLRSDLYIANVLKCRPPKNRNPRKSEIGKCRPWLDRQIDGINPTVIVPMGNFALNLFTTKTISIGKARGQRFDHGGRAILPIYHPAALLYNRSLLPLFREDFRAIIILLAREGGAARKGGRSKKRTA